MMALIGLPATTADAAPKPGDDVVLYCGEEVIPISVRGNGQWTPAHALDSNLVGVPIAFGELRGTFTPYDGSDPVEFTEPPVAKPNAPKSRNLVVDCSFTFSATFSEGTAFAVGTVTLMVPRIHG